MSVDKFCKFKIVPEVGAPINYFSVNVTLAPTSSTNVKPRCAQLKTYFRKFQIKNDVLLASSMMNSSMSTFSKFFDLIKSANKTLIIAQISRYIV